jgi:DMSO/TMAO reductase YedYZ molybdopterin-dependent catalytic subunit
MLIVAGLLLSSSLNHGSAQISEADVIAKNINSTGTLTIVISSNNSVTLSLNDLMDMPKTIVNAELMCFGRPIKGGSWGGVQLGLLLEKAGLVESPASLRFYASDGYSIYVSNSYATQEDVIIAYELDGADLYETLRLVIPGANGESWISMITVILIDPTTYVSSINPQAAYIAVDPLQNIQRSSTQQPPQPSPTPEPKSQPTTQPTVPQPTNQPVQQQNSPNSTLQVEYGYQVLSGIIIVAALSTGYLFYTRKRRKI